MLVMDMDDTLLREDLTISEEVKAKLALAEDQGIIVVLASGRVPHAMHRYIEELGLDKKEGYAVCTNGSYIIETDTFETVHEKLLPKDFALEVHKTVKEMGMPIQVYLDDTIHVSFENDYTNKDCELTGLKKSIMADPDAFVANNKVSKFVIPGDPAVLKDIEVKLKELYSDRANIYTSKPYFLEVLPTDADKRHAIEKLAEILGFDRKEIVAVGDAMNDIGMLKYAGLGIAMKNAADAVKEVADVVLDFSNEEDGIARVVETYIL